VEVAGAEAVGVIGMEAAAVAAMTVVMEDAVVVVVVVVVEGAAGDLDLFARDFCIS